jgi:thioredoxin reductase
MNEIAKEYIKSDVVIIGGGAAGLSAAIECQKHNLTTIIIERNYLPEAIQVWLEDI